MCSRRIYTTDTYLQPTEIYGLKPPGPGGTQLEVACATSPSLTMAIESRHPSRRASTARPGAAARISPTFRENDERASHRHRQPQHRRAIRDSKSQTRATPL